MTENWIEFGAGVFILIAPWMFGFADVPLARWTDMLAGLVFVLVNLWAIYGNGAKTAKADAGRIPAMPALEASSLSGTLKSAIVVKREERPKRARRAKVEKAP